MDLEEIDLGPSRKVESPKQEPAAPAPAFHCDLCDSDLVYKIAEILLPGLATACVDNTSGDIFKGPATVVVEIRKEMVDYVTKRSETFVAESLIEDGSPYVPTSDHPFDIISDFVDDFANSKQNLFSRISGWLLSEKREDKIDDFVQEMELSEFWVMERRISVAETLLRNVDYKSQFHCSDSFNTEEELNTHIGQCSYRSMECANEGCRVRFCAMHMEKHDSECPYKILACEQKCSDLILRREMDRHCITVCPMKLVNCPFYHVGCQSSIPHCNIEQHCSEFLQSHLLHILRLIHKEATMEDLKSRVDEIETASSMEELAKARDVRSLTKRVKDIDAQLGPMEHHSPTAATSKPTDSTDATPSASDEAENRVQSSQEPTSASENPETKISQMQNE